MNIVWFLSFASEIHFSCKNRNTRANYCVHTPHTWHRFWRKNQRLRVFKWIKNNFMLTNSESDYIKNVQNCMGFHVYMIRSCGRTTFLSFSSKNQKKNFFLGEKKNFVFETKKFWTIVEKKYESQLKIFSQNQYWQSYGIKYAAASGRCRGPTRRGNATPISNSCLRGSVYPGKKVWVDLEGTFIFAHT